MPEPANVNFGVKVKLWRRFTNCRRLTERIILALGGTETVEDFTELRNVTEIHFNHGRAHGHGSVSVAFESNIHGTGMTCELENLMEFETELEEAKAEAF